MEEKQHELLSSTKAVDDELVNTKENKKPTICVMFLVFSWVITSFLIGASLFAAPGMRSIFHGAVSEAVGIIATFIAGALVCGWPWWIALGSEKTDAAKAGMVVYSCATVLIATFFSPLISEAPEEGTGLNTALCVVLVWVAYPICGAIGKAASTA